MSQTLKPYQDPLPIANPKGNPYDLRDPHNPTPSRTICLKRADNVKYSEQLPTTAAWTYDGQTPGPTFVVDNTQTVYVRWHNCLGGPLPYTVVVCPDPAPTDFTADQAPTRESIGAAIPQNQPGSGDGVVNDQAKQLRASTVTHQHGGLTPSDSDGWTENVTPYGRHQSTTYGRSAVCEPTSQGSADKDLTQRSCLLWYHDHAIGVTRLNVYAGLFGFWVIRDVIENKLIDVDKVIPDGDHELILLIQDRNLETDDNGDFTGALLHKTETTTAEMFGPYTLVNGKLWPTHTVPAEPMRVRILNGSNARTYCLRLVAVNGIDSGGQPVYGTCHTEDDGLWWQIGTDGGLLDFPVVPGSFGPDVNKSSNPPINRGLVLAPAERADLVIDFGRLAGQKVAFVNTAFAAFHGSTVTYPNKYDASGSIVPEQDPAVDYSVDANKNMVIPAQNAGDASPAFRLPFAHVLQFEVGPDAGVRSNLRPDTPLAADFVRYVHEASEKPMRKEKVLPPGHNHRWIAMTENPTGNLLFRELDAYTTDPDVAAAFPAGAPLIPIRALNGVVTWYQTMAKSFHDPAHFFIPLGGCEVWNILNLTGDTHPVHVHLVQFQVLTRQPYNTSGVLTPQPTVPGYGPATPVNVPSQPDPNEQGFKDTVRVNPGELVSIAAFFDGYCGKYMYHCHILEHEDHDMMRPFIVVAKDAFGMMGDMMSGGMKMKM